MLLWNQVDALQKHFKNVHVHMRLWTRLYGICLSTPGFDWAKCLLIGTQLCRISSVFSPGFSRVGSHHNFLGTMPVDPTSGRVTMATEMLILVAGLSFQPETKILRLKLLHHWVDAGWIFLRTIHLNIVSWEPEGSYHYSTMFHWEPEGQYHHRLCTAIAPFWFSTELRWTAITPFLFSADIIVQG